MQYNTLIISDLHLGSPRSRTDKILQVLAQTQFKTLVINGDLVDCHNLKRFKKSHWKVLSELRRISKTHRVIFVGGNHDGDLEKISLILGLNFVSHYEWMVSNKKFVAVHGHASDYWMRHYPRISDFFTGLYWCLQQLDTKKQHVTRFIKAKSKSWLKVDQTIKDESFDLARQKGVDFVFVGHSHIADQESREGITYINSGSFCEAPCNYIVVDEQGDAKLKEI